MRPSALRNPVPMQDLAPITAAARVILASSARATSVWQSPSPDQSCVHRINTASKRRPHGVGQDAYSFVGTIAEAKGEPSALGAGT